MIENDRIIIEKLEDIKKDLNSGIKLIRDDLIQLGITIVGMLMLMESGISVFYSLLIAAVIAFVLRESYTLGLRKYKAKKRKQYKNE